MERLFRIGNFSFALDLPEGVEPPENFRKFEVTASSVDSAEAEHTFRIHLTDQLPNPRGKARLQHSNLQVFESEEGEERIIGVRGDAQPYAYQREVSELETEIFYHAGQMGYLEIDPAFNSLFSFERRMLAYNSLILHCAYVEYQGKAILFSAPSETGKTTQANLWEKYRGARTVNGDRSLIHKVNGVWCADGWPVCGTSKICYNECMPIHAIVMLRQAPENHVRRLTGMEAFVPLYTQITVNSWNRERVQKCSDLIEDLVSRVPIYELGCTISEEAVEVLEAALYPNCAI